MSEQPRDRLADVLQWVDNHINYERTGPSDDFGASAHDPERRLRHLLRYMELMADPQNAFRSIHITGTNGKTSTARIITSLVLAEGLNSGTYTSPHLERVNERILTNGEPIDDEDLIDVLNAFRLLEPMLGEDKASYFEIFTAAAFRHFADSAVDVGVIEVGVGGLWDATNIIDAPVAVVTNVGLDHMNYLGGTRAEIARHKAGIVNPGATLVLGEDDEELLPIFLARAPGKVLVANRDFGVDNVRLAVGGHVVDLRTPLRQYEDVFLSLHGEYQAINAAVALAAVEAFLDQPLPDEVVREGLGSVQSPGRMEVVRRQPLCVLDGAHNVAGAQALVGSIDREFSVAEGRILVVGMLSPHEPRELLDALQAKRARLLVACTAPSPRAVPAEAIAAVAKEAGIPAVVVEDPVAAAQEALAAARDTEIVLVTGSLYVVGAARAVLLPRHDEGPVRNQLT